MVRAARVSAAGAVGDDRGSASSAPHHAIDIYLRASAPVASTGAPWRRHLSADRAVHPICGGVIAFLQRAACRVAPTCRRDGVLFAAGLITVRSDEASMAIPIYSRRSDVFALPSGCRAASRC